MPTHHHPDGLRWLAIIGALLAMALLFSGCTETRTSTQAQTDKADSVTVSGTAHVPGIGAVPVQLQIERSGNETLRQESESHTKIDAAAIAQQVGAVVGKSLDAAIAKLTGLQIQATAGPVTPTEGGLLGGLGGLTLLAAREWMARRREQQALAEVKAARDRAQAEALDLAKRIDPKAAQT